MNLSIVDYELPDETHSIYEVILHGDRIHTLVTHTPSFVDSWISETLAIHRRRLRHLIVGLDVEWRPNFARNMDNPVATIQICVGRRCLIFQFIHSPYIPQSLALFLNNSSYTFVGVGIREDIEKLIENYNLTVANAVDLGQLAAEAQGVPELRTAGLKALAKEVLGLEVVKPKRIKLSRWDNQWLTLAQVQYACVDAFLSFEIGRCLNAAG